MDTGQVILVTGSGTGFGRRIVETLARQGHSVYAGLRDSAGRNKQQRDALTALALQEGVRLEVVDLDVTDATAIERVVGQILANEEHIDVLVNNAGVMYVGINEGYTLEQARQQLETNFFGPMQLDRAVLPHMRRQRSGLLIHVSSVAGGLTFPFLTLYSASKMAVEALAEGYRYELAPFGIDSVIVEPGPFGTNLLTSQQDPRDHERVAAYGDLAAIPAQMLRETEAMNSAANAQDPQLVAEAVAALVAQRFGTRPLRTIPGYIDFGLGRLNQAKEAAQQELLAAWGLGELLAQREA